MNKRSRIITLLVVAAILLALLTGCNGGPAQGTTDSGATAGNTPQAKDVTLRIGWWGSQVRTDATLAVLEMYTEKTGVQLEPEYMPFDGYFTKFTTLAAANDLFDVFQLGGGFNTYLEQIEPLNEYVDKGLIDVSDMNKDILYLNAINNVLYGVTLGINANSCIAYDPELFSQAGVTEPTDDWTWEDFENIVMKIHEKLGIYGSSQINAGGCGALDMYYDTGEHRFFNSTADGLGFDANDLKPMADFFAMMQRLVNAGAYPDPGVISEIKDIEGDPLITKEAAMVQIPSNQFIALSGVAKRPLKMVFIPKRDANAPTPTAVNSSQMFSIYSKSEFKEEAAKFISFFVNDIEANKILKGERGIPATGKVRAALSADLDDVGKELYAFMDRVAAADDLMEIRYGPASISEIVDHYQLLYEQVVTNKLSPEEAAVLMRQGTEEIINR